MKQGDILVQKYDGPISWLCGTAGEVAGDIQTQLSSKILIIEVQDVGLMHKKVFGLNNGMIIYRYLPNSLHEDWFETTEVST